jgi:hypothetical protein
MKMKHLLAATALMVGAAFGSAPISTAEPEWDIGAYDDCMSKTVRDPATCCLQSGGNISFGDPNVCVAPAAEEIDEAPGRTLPPLRPDSNLPTLSEVPLQPIA